MNADLVARLREYAPHVEGWEDGDGNQIPFSEDLRSAADALTAAEAHIKALETELDMERLAEEGARAILEQTLTERDHFKKMLDFYGPASLEAKKERDDLAGKVAALREVIRRRAEAHEDDAKSSQMGSPEQDWNLGVARTLREFLTSTGPNASDHDERIRSEAREGMCAVVKPPSAP